VALYKWLFEYIKPYWVRLCMAVVFMLGVAGLDSAVIFMVRPVLDEIFLKKDAERLMILPFAVAALFIVKGLFDFMQAYQMKYVGNSIIRDLRERLYRHIQTLSLRYFDNNPTGYIMSRITDDVNQISTSVTTSVTGILKDSFHIIGLLCVALYQDWQLSLIAILSLPVTGTLIVRFGRKVRKFSKKTQHTKGILSALIQEAIFGNKIVKAFGMEAYENQRFQKENRRIFRFAIKTARINAISSPAMETLGGLAAAVIIGIGGYKVITTDSYTAGQFMSFIAALFAMYKPIKGMSRINNALQQGMASVERIRDVMETKPEITDRPGAIDLPTIQDRIEFRDLHFRYGDEWVLKGVDLHIRTGEVVAFAGMSGGGKTTLVHLLPRFYEVNRGGVFIDGSDIRDVTIQSLRRQIAMVTQQTILFNDTVRNNIAYGDVAKSEEQIIEAARMANAHEFIESFTEGYDTMIGDQGVRLSGGQRQRLSIARALLKDAPILILDEATSSLDTESEVLVQEALERLMKNRTTLVIAHRLSTIRNADRIVVIVDGGIVEEGTHDELLAREGEYAKLHRMQFLHEGEGNGAARPVEG